MSRLDDLKLELLTSQLGGGPGPSGLSTVDFGDLGAVESIPFALAMMQDASRPLGAIAHTYSRIGGFAANIASSLVSGTQRYAAIPLLKGTTVKSISFLSGTTALATGTHQFFGLYNDKGKLLASTTDDTSTAWAANTIKTLNLTTPLVVPESGVYYLGILVTATTAPTLSGLAGNAAPLHSSANVYFRPAFNGAGSLTALETTFTQANTAVAEPYAWVK